MPKNHTDCNQFWELPDSTEDVFSLFSPVDVRRARDSSLKNLETLIITLSTRLSVLRHHASFPDPDIAPEKHALNCIRVLTRILPFLYEADHLELWEDKFFWAPRRKRSKESTARPEVLFDGSRPDDATEKESREKIVHVKPLGEELIDNLIDLLFYTDFTLPSNERARKKVTYSIWQSGVGCNTPTTSSKELESNRTELLRLLMTLSSKSLYMPSRTFFPYECTQKANWSRYFICERGKGYHVYNHMSGQAGCAILTVFTIEYCKRRSLELCICVLTKSRRSNTTRLVGASPTTMWFTGTRNSCWFLTAYNSFSS